MFHTTDTANIIGRYQCFTNQLSSIEGMFGILEFEDRI